MTFHCGLSTSSDGAAWGLRKLRVAYFFVKPLRELVFCSHSRTDEQSGASWFKLGALCSISLSLFRINAPLGVGKLGAERRPCCPKTDDG